jgi:DNA polymerase-3 subunit epsilon
MNAGVRIPSFIESLTGISNSMLRTAPPAERVMNEVAEFVGLTPLVAHNASFDQKFWDYELSRIKRNREQSFACSMLLARRLMPSAPNHKLGTLTSWAGLPHTGKAHRAMADAEMAANLTAHLSHELRNTHGIAGVSHQLLCTLQKVPAKKIAEAISKHRGI